MSTPNICRRCKKKRSPDETEETLKYRTCKPCREIERKKKRLKKLAKQGQTDGVNVVNAGVVDTNQHLNVNVPDLRQESLNAKIINIANQASLQSQQQTYERADQNQQRPEDHHLHQLHQQHQQQLPHHQQQQHHQGKVEEKEIPIDESLLKEGQGSDLQSKDDDHHHHQHQDLSALADAHDGQDKNSTFSNDTKNIFAAIQNAEKLIHSEHKDPNADYCLYCGALRDVNDNGRYKLCGNCVVNPLDSNVFSDFGEYLTSIDAGKYSDVKNLIFLKKFELNEIIPDFQTYDQHDPSSNNLESIMNSLITNFINPIINTSGFKFSKGSSNLSAKPYPKAIKVLYKCKQDVKTTQRSSSTSSNQPLSQDSQSSQGNIRKMKTENCNSNMYVSYDISSRTLNIKYNHNTHKTYLEKLYTDELINGVKDYLRTDNDLESIFEKLSSPAFNTHNERIRNEILSLKKVNFIRDFSHLL